MSLKRTYEIERSTASQVISNKLLSCTNHQLAEILEVFEESEFRNYIVRDREWMVEDSDKVIKDVSEF